MDIFAVAYDTGSGYGSVGLLGDFSEDDSQVLIGDPVLGTSWIPVEQCYHVLSGGIVNPFVEPMLMGSMLTPGVHEAERLAANRGEQQFVGGYEVAWEKIRHWREGVAPDWRTIALVAIFARSTIQTNIKTAESSYKQFAPVLLDMLDIGYVLRKQDVYELPGFHSLGMHKTRSESFVQIATEFAPQLAQALVESKEYTRKFRNRIVQTMPLPLGIGIAKTSFVLSLLGRDAACMDARILDYYIPDIEERKRLLDTFTAKTRTGTMSELTVARYNKIEGRLRDNRFYDPRHPMPFAKAQWYLWESLGREGDVQTHQVLWESLGL